MPAGLDSLGAIYASQGIELAPGLRYYADFLDPKEQAVLLGDVRAAIAAAPLFQPTMPKTGTPLSVCMTNCGALGWTADRAGYQYRPVHPETGRPWPEIPALARRTWRALANYPLPPDACLVNYYRSNARMGLHQDRDEEALDAPVVSLSLGDTCVFRFGGLERRAPTRSIKLRSGDALVLGGAARLVFHGVDRILGGSSSLLPEGGRFNLTMRRVRGDPDDLRD